jgi:mono/diheme cytochrome c family protein
MHKIQKSPLLLLGLLLLASVLLARAKNPDQVAHPQKSSETQERERLLALGKKFFVERCASCHDERGDKPLSSGPPLAQRDLSAEDLARLVSGRLKDATDEQKRAVALYISSFMKQK